MPKLTSRQLLALQLIGRSCANGLAPTLREIGNAMGIHSTNGVNDHLRALERKGYIRRESMKSRAIRLTARGSEAVGLSNANMARSALLEDVYEAAKVLVIVPVSQMPGALADLADAVDAVNHIDSVDRAIDRREALQAELRASSEELDELLGADAIRKAAS